MKKGYKYKLKVKNSQTKFLKDLMFSAVQTYNIIHSIKETERENNIKLIKQNLPPKYIKDSLIDTQVTKILQSRNLIYKNNIIQQTRIEYNSETQKIIKKITNGINVGKRGFKKYRHNSKQSFKVTSASFSIIDTDNPKIKVLKLFKNKYKIIWSRDLPSKPKSLKISFDGIDFFVSFSVEIKAKKINHKGTKKIGLDMNNKSIDMGNKKIYHKINIKSIKDKKLQEKLLKLERTQSKRVDKAKKTKTKLGKNFYKTLIKVKKINKKITNKRNDRLHKLTNNIIKFIFDNKFNHLVVEDLNVRQMTVKTTSQNKNKLLGKLKTKSMKKNILDISYSRFYEILEYKCEQFGLLYSKVNPKNTSKECSACGKIKTDLQLSDRQYVCKCGLDIPRDYNACLNIIKRA